MKTWISIIICFLLASGITVKAQNLVMKLQSEVTVAGPQYGATIAYELKNKFAIGATYQSEFPMSSEKQEINELHAGLIQIPLVKKENINFFFNTRIGLSNQKFFVFIPGLETRIGITKRSGVAFEMGMRMNYPSVAGKIYTTIF